MATVVEKTAIKREKGWLYYVDKRGDVSPTLAYNAANPEEPIAHKRVQAVLWDECGAFSSIVQRTMLQFGYGACGFIRAAHLLRGRWTGQRLRRRWRSTSRRTTRRPRLNRWGRW